MRGGSLVKLVWLHEIVLENLPYFAKAVSSMLGPGHHGTEEHLEHHALEMSCRGADNPCIPSWELTTFSTGSQPHFNADVTLEKSCVAQGQGLIPTITALHALLCAHAEREEKSEALMVVASMRGITDSLVACMSHSH